MVEEAVCFSVWWCGVMEMMQRKPSKHGAFPSRGDLLISVFVSTEWDSIEMSHTSVSSAETQLSDPGARLRAHCWGRHTHSPAAMGPDTHRGKRLVYTTVCGWALNQGGTGACGTPTLPWSSCCPPCCRESCAAVEHGGGKGGNLWH